MDEGGVMPPEHHTTRVANPTTRHLGRDANAWTLDPSPILQRLEALHPLQVQEILEGQRQVSKLLRNPHQSQRPANMVR